MKPIRFALLISIALILLLSASSALAALEISESSESFEVDFSNLREDDGDDLDFTHTIELSNTDSTAVDVSFSVDATDSTYEVQLVSEDDESFTLEAGASRSIDLEITADARSGTDEGTDSDVIEVTANSNTFSLDAQIVQMFDLDNIYFYVDDFAETTMDSDDSDDGTEDLTVAPGEPVDIYFNIENLFDEEYNRGDLEFTIEIELDDRDFGDDINEDITFTIDSGLEIDDSDRDIVLSFDVPTTAKDEEYDLEITIEAQDDNGAEYSEDIVAEIQVEREDDDIRLENIRFEPETLSCTRDFSLRMDARNFGSDRQNGAVVTLESGELGLNEFGDARQSFTLGYGHDEDTNVEALIFRLQAPQNLNAGTYPITIRSFYDGDKITDQQVARLIIEDCASSTPSEGSETSDSAGSDTGSNNPDVPTNSGSQGTNNQGSSNDATVDAENIPEGTVSTVEKSYSLADLQLAMTLVLAVLVAAILIALMVFAARR